MGSLMAMDAEQKRDEAGRWSSGAGSDVKGGHSYYKGNEQLGHVVPTRKNNPGKHEAHVQSTVSGRLMNIGTYHSRENAQRAVEGYHTPTMDEQKRDSDGKFGSGGGGKKGGDYKVTQSRSEMIKDLRANLAGKPKGWNTPAEEHLKKIEGMSDAEYKMHSYSLQRMVDTAKDESPAPTFGEAGRQARKLARDCMSGRFRK